MSSSKSKQQVRPESKVRKIAGVAKADHGVSSKEEGLVSLYATADLPSAAAMVDGCLAFDTTVNKLKMTKAGSWVLCN